MILPVRLHRIAFLWLAALALCLGFATPGGAASPPDAVSNETLKKLTPDQRKTLKTYLAARRAYERKLASYWSSVEAKRKRRRTKHARHLKLTAKDYVKEQPPAYAGPARPDDIYALLPRPPEAKEKKPSRPPVPIVEDFLRAARAQYGFAPNRIGEEEFMIYYALSALKLGLTGEQVVRVYALETGGVGAQDLQSGYNAKTKRAASTALGYAQLLAANSVGEIRDHGDEFAARLEALASADGVEPENARRLRHKASVLRRMYADARRLPEKWSAHVEFAKSEKGLAMHAMNLDGDVGPWMQVTKLQGIRDFAARKGMMAMTGAELELMNLAGPGRGFEMMQPIARDMPTANFFDRGGYERNPVVNGKTGAELLAKLDGIMDRNLKKDGAVQFAHIFDKLSRKLGEPKQASAVESE
jgi:hypothetical protein